MGEARLSDLGTACDKEMLGAIKQGWAALDVEKRRKNERRLHLLGCSEYFDAETLARFKTENASWLLLSPGVENPDIKQLVALLESPDELVREQALRTLLRLETHDPVVSQLLLERALHAMQHRWAQRILTRQMSSELLEQLWNLHPEEPRAERARRRLLLAHWEALPARVQGALFEHWVVAEWRFRRSTALGQPTPIALDLRFLPPGQDFDGLELTAQVLELSFDDRALPIEAQMTTKAHLRGPGHALLDFDLTPHLELVGAYPLSGKAKITLSRQGSPLFERDYVFKRSKFRVYLGADQGPPKTRHEAALGESLRQALNVDLSFEGERMALFDGGLLKKRQPIALRHGAPIALGLSLDEAQSIALACRVQGRLLGGSWRELGHGAIPEGEQQQRPVYLDLSQLCPSKGPCRVELRLRASLKEARSWPEIDSYWGKHIDLGQLVFEVANHGRGHHFEAIFDQLTQSP